MNESYGAFMIGGGGGDGPTYDEENIKNKLDETILSGRTGRKLLKNQKPMASEDISAYN